MSISKAVLAVALVVIAAADRASAQAPPAGPFVRGEILVKFRPGVDPGAKADAHRSARATPMIETARTNVQRVRVPGGSERAAIARYRGNPNVLYAEPNFVRAIPMPAAHPPAFGTVPGDYYFHEQWALDNTGQSFYCIPWFSGELCFYRGTPDADIDAPEAWAITKGSPAVTVAVIDSGVDYTHPDLAANYAGGDDFVFFDGDPMDDHGHGTHVAGTIAAAMNNATGSPVEEEEGVTGVAPNARIRAYKVCRSNGTCDDFAIQQAIVRAIADGANVINMSLGSSEYSQSLDDAVQEAWNAGLVVVAAAGNEGTTVPFYPAALNNVISVAAFDEDHRRPAFSNYGNWVDISAPGNVIISAERLAACAASTTPGRTGCYSRKSGTSMASPHAAGAAALVWSRSDVTSNSQVVEILLASADRMGVGAERLDAWTVHGGLNVHDAISYGLTNLPPAADAGPDQTVIDADGDGAEMVTLDGAASSDRDGTIAGYEWSRDGVFVAAGAAPSVWLAVGRHTLTLEVTDDEGSTAMDTMVARVNPANEVSLTAATPLAAEAGPADGVVTVSRTGSTGVALIVQVSVGGTASPATDYQPIPATVTIDAGSASAAIRVTPIDDDAIENDESVILSLVPSAAYSIGSPREAIITIVSDDVPPDLVVASAAAPAAGGAGAEIVVTDTTKNQGGGPSQPSKTGFYLSTNSLLDASDVLLGTRQVPGLEPAAADVQSTPLPVPSSTAAGPYYLFAKADVDAAVEESVEGNNIRVIGLIRIGPDLIVSALVAPAGAAAGGTFAVSVTTKNQGGGGAGASATRFYLSSNTLLDASDVALGSPSVPPLPGGGADTVSAPLTLPAGTAVGGYYVIAAADAANAVPETAENNNTRASSLVTVGPDLLVTAVSAASTGAPGATIVVTDSTKNQGAGPAGASSTAFYLSADTSFGATDVFLGSRAIGEIAPGGTATASVPLQIPPATPAGSYFLIARADWSNSVPETVETNNTRTGGSIRLGGDLVLTALSASATAKPGGPITVTDTTRNQGPAPVSDSQTGFYLSPNGILNSIDNVFLGSRPVGALDPSESNTASTQLVIPPATAPGRYYVIGAADWNGAAAEGNEANNTRISISVRVGPDLVPTGFSAASSAVAGTSLTATQTTRNDGGDTAAASVTGFYLSSNVTLDAGDLLLAVRTVPSLSAGASNTGSVALPISASTAAGTWYLIARVDGDDAIAEALENNNTLVRSLTIAAAP